MPGRGCLAIDTHSQETRDAMANNIQTYCELGSSEIMTKDKIIDKEVTRSMTLILSYLPF